MPKSEYLQPPRSTPDDSLITGPGPGGDTPRYFPVPPIKLIIMSAVTFGIYQIYWFYKNWQYVKRRDDSKIMPFWRAIFGVIWFYPLLKDIDAHSDEDYDAQDVVLAAAYVVLAGLSWRLPDPYWLITFGSILLLVPVSRRLGGLNGHDVAIVEDHGRFGLLNIIGIAILSPLLVFIVASTLHFMPSTQVVDGSRLWPWQIGFLQDQGLLEDGERVIYFYSAGLFSIKEDGNIVTDRSLISYYQNPETGELLGDFAHYEDIDTAEVEFSESAFADTIVTVTRNDGTTFELWVSPEEEKDRIFAEAIWSRVGK